MTDIISVLITAATATNSSLFALSVSTKLTAATYAFTFQGAIQSSFTGC